MGKDKGFFERLCCYCPLTLFGSSTFEVTHVNFNNNNSNNNNKLNGKSDLPKSSGKQFDGEVVSDLPPEKECSKTSLEASTTSGFSNANEIKTSNSNDGKNLSNSSLQVYTVGLIKTDKNGEQNLSTINTLVKYPKEIPNDKEKIREKFKAIFEKFFDKKVSVRVRNYEVDVKDFFIYVDQQRHATCRIEMLAILYYWVLAAEGIGALESNSIDLDNNIINSYKQEIEGIKLPEDFGAGFKELLICALEEVQERQIQLLNNKTEVNISKSSSPK